MSVDTTFAALADPYRRRTIELLGESPRRAGELAQLLDLTAPAMSRHLRTLRQAGLVEEQSPDFDARVRVYALRREGMTELKAWLADAESLWIDQLSALKTHIERTS